MPKIKDIARQLELLAPLAHQESYDNSGLLAGDPDAELRDVLICLEITDAVIEEAVSRGCNLIISHHPLIFKPIKKITGAHWTERCLLRAIRNEIGLYSIHTNLDNVVGGVNNALAHRIGLEKVRILAPRTGTLSKLTTFVPTESLREVLDALHEAGAGIIGNYESCSFRVRGTGTFRPSAGAQPYIGRREHLEEIEEERIEVIFPAHRKSDLLSALRRSHPYEEVAYYLHDLANEDGGIGSGMIGCLSEPMEFDAFLALLKDRFRTPVVRHSAFTRGLVQSIAVCGGAGSFLIPRALASGADVFVSADFKYHDFFEGQPAMAIADIGHYESEQWTKELLAKFLSQKFPNIALRLSEVVTNPIHYT